MRLSSTVKNNETTKCKKEDYHIYIFLREIFLEEWSIFYCRNVENDLTEPKFKDIYDQRYLSLSVFIFVMATTTNK